MKVIGITGGVGAGKSCIISFLKDNYNCKFVMADDLAKSLCKKGEICYPDLVNLLGDDCLDDNNEINRYIMAQKIFNNDNLLEKVNSIIHPAVKENIINQISFLKNEGLLDFFFIEAALLIEDGYKDIVDELWYIYTDIEIRRERLKNTRGYDDSKINSIFANQLSDDEFKKNSDFIINNSYSLENSFEQIRERMSLYGCHIK